MKDVLLGASICMVSIGGTLVALDHLFAGWLVAFGALGGVVAVALHANERG